MPLSVIIHTKNAGSTLEAALNSVQFADERLVVDMESSDQTVQIANRLAAKVLHHSDVGYADPARNFGLSKASHDWIFVLDADEEVPESLREFIQDVVAGTAEPAVDAYYIPRKNIIFAKGLEHTGWWPDYQLRLFRKGTVHWPDGVHRLPDVTGTSHQLPATVKFAILHHNYQTVDQFIDRLNRYTSIKAEELVKQTDQKSLTGSEAVTTFSEEFLRRFFGNQGYKDGTHGLSLSLLQAMYELVVQLKVWQTAGFPTQTDERATMQSLKKFDHDLRYWIADWHVHHTTGWQKWWWQLRRKYHW